jgi:hypothetical protein
MNKPTRTLTRLAFAASLAGPTLVACGGDSQPPIEPAQLSQVTATRSRAVISTVSKGVQFTSDDTFVLTRMGNRVTSPPVTVRSQTPVVMIAKSVPPLRGLLGHPERTKAALTRSVVYDTVGESNLSTQLDDGSKDLEELLKDRICTDANLESKTDSEVVYRLKPEGTCVPLSSEATTTPDPECIDDLTKLAVRVAMTRDGADGAKLRVLIGEPRAELLAFIVHDTSLALELDLAQTKKAADLANAALSDPNDPTTKDDELKQLSGKVRFAVDKLGEQKFEFSTSVLQAITMDVVDAMGGYLAGFTTAARPNPVFAVTADGATKTIDFAVDVGQTQVKTTWDPKDTGAHNQDLSVVLGGLTGQMAARDDQEKVTIRGLGLGAGSTHVDVRGTPIFALDVNANDGRKLDLTADASDAKRTAIELDPKLDLSLGFHLGVVQSELTEAPAAGTVDETYRFLAAGAKPVRLELVPDDAVTGTKGGVKLAAGTLTISSDKAPQATVTVPTGQCLVNVTPGPGAHPVLGNLGAGACN